jgi:predicted phosphodiesterase
MTNRQLAKELIEEKSDKDGKCTLSKKKLAEILVKRYPATFRNPENARQAVRQVTGAAGKIARKENGVRIEWKGLSLPEPEKNDYSKVIIHEKRIGILSDIHFPYYDKQALNAAIKYLKEWKPDCIVLNGDIIDCYTLSNWEKDPRKRSFAYELDMLKAFFTQLRKMWPTQRIIFKSGNHEDRYEKVILQRVPEFVDVELFTFESVIQANQYKIQVVGGKRLLKAGHLNIAHGHEFARGMVGPVNPARGFYMKAKANVIGGHHHQRSEHEEPDLNDKTTAAWSTGCLCELHPHYAPINKWGHGFATVEIQGENFKVNNHKIINGKVL